MSSRDGTSDWSSLVIDQRVSADPLDDADFRVWMRGQRIFVSSTMDAELAPYRKAVREYIESAGGEAVMWETLAPREENPTGAFLGGVQRSTVCVIMAGESYGVDDEEGFSPTHREVEKAKEEHIPRLLLTLNSPRRDGPMNRMIRSLYPSVSGLSVDSVSSAVVNLDGALRRMAAEAHYIWIKLGRFVFVGQVDQTGSQSGRSFTVRADVASSDVRRGLLALPEGYRSVQRLTWPDECHRVSVDSVRTVTTSHGSQAVELVCSEVEREGGPMVINFNGMGRIEQARQWLAQVWLGEPAPRQGQGRRDLGMLLGMVTPDGPVLPEVLGGAGAGLWQTAGLTRLYLVESLSKKWGGYFSELSVGPANDRVVPIAGTVVFPAEATNLSDETLPITGAVPRR